MELTRKQILKGNYAYPTGFVVLRQTHHVRKRLEERGLDLECIPTMVKVTKNNLQSARCLNENKLTSVVIKLDYTSGKWMYLCLNPFDGALKSIWFNEKRRKRNNKQTI